MSNVPIVELVRRDLLNREKVEPFAGPEALLDAYDEALNLVIYLRHAIENWVGRPGTPPSKALLLPTEEIGGLC